MLRGIKQIEDILENVQRQVARQVKIQQRKEASVPILKPSEKKFDLTMKYMPKFFEWVLDKTKQPDKWKEKLKKNKEKEIKGLASDLKLTPQEYMEKHTPKPRTRKKPQHYNPQAYVTDKAKAKPSAQKHRTRIQLQPAEAPTGEQTGLPDSQTEWKEIQHKGKTVWHPPKKAYRQLNKGGRYSRSRFYSNAPKKQLHPQASELPALPDSKKPVISPAELKPATVPILNPWKDNDRVKDLTGSYPCTAPTIQIPYEEPKAPAREPIRIARTGNRTRARVMPRETYIPQYQFDQLKPVFRSFVKDITAEKYQTPRTLKPTYVRTVIPEETLAEAPGFARLRVESLLRTVNRKLILRKRQIDKQKERVKTLTAPRVPRTVEKPASDAGDWEDIKPRAKSMPRLSMQENPFADSGMPASESQTPQIRPIRGRAQSLRHRVREEWN